MFEVIPEPEFAEWFAALPEPLAEEVAAALEVVARAAETVDPPGVSRALLWFDGTGARPAPGIADFGQALALVESARSMHAVLAWQRELVSCLEAPAFRARLAQLSQPAAEVAVETVERLRAELRAWQREIVLAVGAGRWSSSDASERRATLTRELSHVLGLLGLGPGEFITLSNGLRELVISSTEPKLRLLIGIDAVGKRLVVLLGERLTRAYYGDSVRSAEKRWGRYQEAVFTKEHEGP
jgi:hypothetical protein